MTNVELAPGAVSSDTLASEVTTQIENAQDTADTALSNAAAAQSTAGTALSNATTAQSTADGKNKIYRQTSEPTGGTYASGDIWFDTDDNNKIYRYDSSIAPPASKWVAVQLGGNALANINANSITAGTIDASVITVSNINAGNISTGAINAGGVEIGNDVGPGDGHNGLSLSSGDFNNIFLRRESDSVVFFRVNSGGANSMTFDSSSGVLNIAGTVTASAGAIGGFTLSGASLASSNQSVETQMYTNEGGPYGSSSLKSTYKGGFLTRETTTGAWSAQAYDGFYSITPIGGTDRIAYFRRGAATVTNGTQRLWLDASDNCIKYTSDGSGSFPGIITSEYCRLSFGTSGVVYTNNDLAVGTTSNQSTSNVAGTKGIWLQGSDGLLTVTKGVSGETCMVVNNTVAGNTSQSAIVFRRRGTEVGSITVTGSATSFNPSSDYRLKEDIKPVVDSLGVIQQLTPVTFKWKDGSEDGSDVYGLIAHEVQQVLPYVVVGEKDAVRDDGSPKYQQMDYTKLIPLLLAGVQDLTAKVLQLEAEIESLKNA